jgi:hypothetical protein
MTPAQINRKLTLISRLTAPEINGWIKARDIDHRPVTPLEREALERRAKQVGARLERMP